VPDILRQKKMGLFPAYFCGGSIRSLIQPQQKESKSRRERTPKSTEA